MNNYKSILTAQRLGLIEFARTINPTHLVTLNFHARYDQQTAELKIGRWFTLVNRRLFRKLRPEPDQKLEFVAFPEYTAAGHIHYHAVMRVPPSKLSDFVTYGQSRWKRIVPTSTFHVRPIEDGENDIENTLLYVTKCASASDVIHSGMFHQ